MVDLTRPDVVPGALDVARQAGALGRLLHFAFVDADVVGWAHRLGRQVSAWTVDEPAEMVRLLRAGVDALVTNRIEVLRRLLDRRLAAPCRPDRRASGSGSGRQRRPRSSLKGCRSMGCRTGEGSTTWPW